MQCTPYDPREDAKTAKKGSRVRSVVVPGLQTLLNYAVKNGFEHHVAVSLSQCAGAVNEAMSKYLGWDVYNHDR